MEGQMVCRCFVLFFFKLRLNLATTEKNFCIDCAPWKLTKAPNSYDSTLVLWIFEGFTHAVSVDESPSLLHNPDCMFNWRLEED